MARLLPCPGCSRHVRITESLCPFCAEALPLSYQSAGVARVPTSRLGRAAKFAFGAAVAGTLAVTGCSDDGGSEDTGVADTGTADTGTGDTGTGDSGTTDTGTADTGAGDTSTADTGAGDTGAGDAGDAMMDDTGAGGLLYGAPPDTGT